MIESTQAPATSFERNAASMARAPSGPRRIRTVTSVISASCPSLPVSKPSQS